MKTSLIVSFFKANWHQFCPTCFFTSICSNIFHVKKSPYVRIMKGNNKFKTETITFSPHLIFPHKWFVIGMGYKI